MVHLPILPLPTVDSQFCDRVIRVSCTKILGARQERGGPKLYKNLLVLHTLKRAREEQKKIEAIETAMLITKNVLDLIDEDEEMIQPPLEFSVTDDEDGLVLDADAPLVFATEATEMCELEEEPLKKISPPPAPLSSALNDALAKIGSSIDRKRKPNSKTVAAQPQKKSTRVTISCK